MGQENLMLRRTYYNRREQYLSRQRTLVCWSSETPDDKQSLTASMCPWKSDATGLCVVKKRRPRTTLASLPPTSLRCIGLYTFADMASESPVFPPHIHTTVNMGKNKNKEFTFPDESPNAHVATTLIIDTHTHLLTTFTPTKPNTRPENTTAFGTLGLTLSDNQLIIYCMVTSGVYYISIRLDILKHFQSPTWMNGIQSTNASPRSRAHFMASCSARTASR